MPSPRDILYGPWRAVAVLGVTQVVAWGTIFYSPVLTVPLIAAERGWSLAFAMAGFSLGLLVAGLIADRKSTRLNSSHVKRSRMPSSA